MRTKRYKILIICMGICIMSSMVTIPTYTVNAESHDGQDMAYAILRNTSWYVSSSYSDTDEYGTDQGTILSSLGTRTPTHGSTFLFLSTGIAGNVPVTTNGHNPGDERGSWFEGGQYWDPHDTATLTLTLDVPLYMHYLYYDVQFFSAEYPEYVGTQYNDKLTVTVKVNCQGGEETTYICDVNSGDFVLDANGIPGTGFDIFATSGWPGDVDWVTTTPGPGADAGATALVTREHPVRPNEQVTITFEIQDAGDNLFDSAAFIDNLMFSGFARTEMISRKTVQDLNGGLVECGDTLEYTVTISNTGSADQGNNDGHEFIDTIPDNTTYVPGSLTATSGSIDYDPVFNQITWDGGIPAESSVAITFRTTINNSLVNGSCISNQGEVHWDTIEDGVNDAIELTDDPSLDDGIDQDGDGETGDDDPTKLYVISFDPPSTVTEDFSDDTAGKSATQQYFGHTWFNTSNGCLGNIFEVASAYSYATPQSFKTKLRSTGSPQYWNYTLPELSRDLEAWEICFACGTTSEPADLLLEFKNQADANIAKIYFEYVQQGSNTPLDRAPQVSFWDPTASNWHQLTTDYTNGSLLNGWYKLRIEKNGSTAITYSLYQASIGLVDTVTADTLTAAFENFKNIKWSSSYDPVVCPMFFWDDHVLDLT